MQPRVRRMCLRHGSGNESCLEYFDSQDMCVPWVPLQIDVTDSSLGLFFAALVPFLTFLAFGMTGLEGWVVVACVMLPVRMEIGENSSLSR